MRTKQLFAALDRVDREYEHGPARALTKMLRGVVMRPFDWEDDGWNEPEDENLAKLLMEREGVALDRTTYRECLILRLAFCLEMVLRGDNDVAVREHLEDAPKWVAMLDERAA